MFAGLGNQDEIYDSTIKDVVFENFGEPEGPEEQQNKHTFI